jgi:hypothetical protein
MCVVCTSPCVFRFCNRQTNSGTTTPVLVDSLTKIQYAKLRTNAMPVNLQPKT